VGAVHQFQSLFGPVTGMESLKMQSAKASHEDVSSPLSIEKSRISAGAAVFAQGFAA